MVCYTLTASAHLQGSRDMLILTRRTGETILIGDDIEIIILAVDGGQTRVGIEAHEDVKILRGELRSEDLIR
jgi:carbon storage regulator